MTKIKHEDLIFLPLGGSNEIGMNVNLYHYKGKWIIIDCGAGFADDYFPGVQMLAPDLKFVYENRDDFLGIVLTHAHEDHLGSVGWLWDQLQLPIYAAPFTAAVVKNKLEQSGFLGAAEVNIVQPNSRFEVGPFDMEFVHLTHSVPEMNAVMLRTEYGNILHTGDWKLDPNPVVCAPTSISRLKELGDEGVMAIVCDSTNVFTEKHSGSEGDIKDSLVSLMKDKTGLVCVTTFASNVARIHSIASAAKECGRKVVLCGLSLHKITTFAKDCGFLLDLEDFVSDKDLKKYSRKDLLVVATGCQGEGNAAMSKIVNGKHQTVRLTPNDTVIFSSKIIPGNEKTIFKLFNSLSRIGCDVMTEKDHFVHVSGHPSKEEMKELYGYVRPEICIPVHGEPVHLKEHVRLAKEEWNVPKQIELQNGEVIKLAPGEPKSIGHEPFGYFGVERGNMLLPADGNVLRMRRRMMNEGIVFVNLVLDRKSGKLVAEPGLSMPGVLDEEEYSDLMLQITDELSDVIQAQKDTSDDNMFKTSRRVVRRFVKELMGKYPMVEVHISRV
jgi:ribonuclease J